jgi:hypothetical protein
VNVIKTYRHDGAGVLHYLECWNDRTSFLVHEGKVGTKGKCLSHVIRHRTFPSSPTREEHLAAFWARATSEGYAELSDDDHGSLVLQVKVLSDDLSDDHDLPVLDDLPDALNNYIGWRGVGHYDGNDVGRGKINFFLPVVDTASAVTVVRRFLKEFDTHQPLLIATRPPKSVDPSADYEVAWSQRKSDRENFSLL